MNDERYTAYPQEQEFLLMEGIFLWVIKVEELRVPDWEQERNPKKGEEAEEGEQQQSPLRPITVVHLYHCW